MTTPAPTGHTFDTAESRRLEAVYRTPDIVAQRAATLTALSPAPGERILDVGCGPGLLTADLADAVGPAGHVTGIRADSLVSGGVQR